MPCRSGAVIAASARNAGPPELHRGRPVARAKRSDPRRLRYAWEQVGTARAPAHDGGDRHAAYNFNVILPIFAGGRLPPRRRHTWGAHGGDGRRRPGSALFTARAGRPATAADRRWSSLRSVDHRCCLRALVDLDHLCSSPMGGASVDVHRHRQLAAPADAMRGDARPRHGALGDRLPGSRRSSAADRFLPGHLGARPTLALAGGRHAPHGIARRSRFRATRAAAPRKPVQARRSVTRSAAAPRAPHPPAPRSPSSRRLKPPDGGAQPDGWASSDHPDVDLAGPWTTDHVPPQPGRMVPAGAADEAHAAGSAAASAGSSRRTSSHGGADAPLGHEEAHDRGHER